MSRTRSLFIFEQSHSCDCCLNEKIRKKMTDSDNHDVDCYPQMRNRFLDYFIQSLLYHYLEFHSLPMERTRALIGIGVLIRKRR